MQTALELNFRHIKAYLQRLQRVQKQFQLTKSFSECCRLANLINEREDRIKRLLDVRKGLLVRNVA